MEVLVAVAVLSIIVVGFGQVLTQARRTVGIAQLKIKQLQHVRAIRECFTKDLQRVSKNGFLRIGTVGSNQTIVMVAAGESIGRVAKSGKLAQGNAAAIVYGRGGNSLPVCSVLWCFWDCRSSAERSTSSVRPSKR